MTSQNQRFIRQVSPHNKRVLAEFPVQGQEEVSRACEAGWRAFENNTASLSQRLKKVEALRKIVASRADELAALISCEVGKPFAEAYSAEVASVLDTCAWLTKNAERLLRPQSIKLGNPLAWSKRCYLTFEPLGVVGIISPWNFPFAIPMLSILHAVTAGNTVVLKPSEKSTLTGLKIKELFELAGFPENTVQVVTGDGETGKYLSESRLGRLILTGSVGAGKNILRQSAHRLTPVTLELGGKDAAIVMPDAPVEFTARGLVWGAFTNTGQACASVERAYIVRGPNTEKLIEEICKLTRQLVVGSPESTSTDVGPVIDERQLGKIKEHIADATGKGARILCGGRELSELGGYFLEPTVLAGCNHGMIVMTEETFGPVLPIVVVESVEEAVRLANDSEFGLTASVWSANTRAAEALSPKLHVGTVYVNDCIFSHAAPELPWGGVKASGFGRSHCHLGLSEMVHVKNTNVDSARGKGRLWWYPYGQRVTSMLSGGIQLMHGAFPTGRLRGLFDFACGFLKKDGKKDNVRR